MAGHGQRIWGVVCFVAVALLVWRIQAGAISLDNDGDIKLGVRTYVNARVGTEDTNSNEVRVPAANGSTLISDSRTFPFSAAGHLRQNRAYIEAELDHDLSRLIKEDVGPLHLLNTLPFRVRGLKYHLTFRGEGEGLYDWGPSEYSTHNQYITGPGSDPRVTLPDNPVTNFSANVPQARNLLRKIGTDRERLFQAYSELEVGDLFLRIGRQVWSWGETDAFQLMDHINPIDSSFGGFLVPLDERRVPLDMIRAEYRIGDYGAFSEMAIQGYAAFDNQVGFAPGTPTGSPWALPNLGAPSSTTFTSQERPTRAIGDARGGGRFVFNAFDATFSLAHYYTYFDVPTLNVVVNPGFPTGIPFGTGVDIPNCPNCKYSAWAQQDAPRVQVSGATTTFAVPSLYSVVRSEAAYFRGEPRFRQSELDPFVFHFRNPDGSLLPTGESGRSSSGRRVGDSFNYVLGFDVNQWIRALNANQTFFFSTQFFYKHLFGMPQRTTIIGHTGEGNLYDDDVLPVPEKNLARTGAQQALGAVEPIFIRNQENQYLQTLFIGTSYHSGEVNPGLTFFYDWSGALVAQPEIALSRDPFRFIINYSWLDAGRYKGNSGVSLLKDRDNVEFRLEYVI
jgi:hypothetical protein